METVLSTRRIAGPVILDHRPQLRHISVDRYQILTAARR